MVDIRRVEFVVRGDEEATTAFIQKLTKDLFDSSDVEHDPHIGLIHMPLEDKPLCVVEDNFGTYTIAYQDQIV